MSATTSRQKTGLVLAGLLSALSVPSTFGSIPDGETGPPDNVLVLDSVLGVIGVVAVVVVWRTGSRGAARVLVGALGVMALTAMPAFFVDVPAAVKMLVGGTTLLAIVAAALVLSPAPPRALVHDSREA